MTDEAASRFGPFAFELTAEEANAAASRAALRAALSGGLLKSHLAPLAAFALALLFAAILAFTGLMSRRGAEIALLAAASLYMAHRLWTRRRFLQARRQALAWTKQWREAGPLRVDVSGDRLLVSGAGFQSTLLFSEAEDVEDAGGLVYVWRRAQTPAVLPSRIFSGEKDLADFLGFARSRLSHSRGSK